MNITKRDPLTGKENTLDLPITEEQFKAWQNGGMIQRVMPHLTPDEREFVISGLMPGEFDKLFPPEED